MKTDYLPGDSTQAEGEFVAEFWDQKWQDQAQQHVRQQQLRRSEEYRFLQRTVPALRSDEPAGRMDILDCGCGLGDWTMLFREDGHRTIGLDIASETIGRLRQAHGDTFRLGDFRKIDTPDASFDLVINWGGIEHFEEGPRTAIQEAFRVLRPGGAFVATTPCHNVRLFLLEACGGRSAVQPVPPFGQRFYQYRFTRAELEDHFRACGFQQVRSRIIGGEQGLHRCLQHELGWLGTRLPSRLRTGVERAGGILLRPLLGHMVICCGTKP